MLGLQDRVARSPGVAHDLVLLAVYLDRRSRVHRFAGEEEGNPVSVGQLALIGGLVRAALLKLANGLDADRLALEIAELVLGLRRLPKDERARPVDDFREQLGPPPVAP